MHSNVNYGKQVFTIDNTKYILYIYDDENSIPHCHIIISNLNKEKEVCVRLDKSEYFYHDKQNIFTKNEKEVFIKFINSKNKFGIIIWNWAVSTWDGFAQNNENMIRINIKKIPNYNLLKIEKEGKE